MNINIPAFEQWENLNQKVQSVIEQTNVFSGDYAVRVGPSLGAHLQETVISLAQFYSHKKICAVLPGSSPWIEKILPFLYKDGFEVQIYSEKCGDLVTWAESLKANTLFTIFCIDHAVTAELYDYGDLEKKLNEKKIFSLGLSHFSHCYQSSEDVLPYTIRLCSLSEHSILVHGNKLKAPSLFSPLLTWSESVSQNILNYKWQLKEQKEKVLEIEKALPQGFQSWIFKNNQRLYDRAVFYHKELGADSIIHFIEKKSGHVLLDVNKQVSHLETTHLCRWGGSLKQYDWWLPKPEDNILRGLLLLEVDYLINNNISTQQFVDWLNQANKECRIG